MTMRELLESTILERRTILAPILTDGALMMMYADRGTGKTYVAMSMSYAIATGSNVLGWTCAEPMPVLYVDGEMPMASLQVRLRGIAQGAPDAKMPEDDYFRILAADSHPDGIPDLATPAGQQTIEDNLGPARVVILDNLSTLSGARENEGDDWLPIQRFLLQLRRKGIAVILVHHAGRNGTARGTSRREDTLDTIIRLKRPDDYEPDQGARFIISFEKARGFSGTDANPIEATLVIGPETRMVSWTYGAPSDKHAQAMEMFAMGKTPRGMMEELEISKATAYRWYKEFRSSGG
jgi:putative DNA primase/helicase